MVRFILSANKASLADGVYTYRLDQRLNNASLLQLKKCSFALTTDGTPPVAIYLRSSAVHRLSSHKHTVELKANNHQAASDILAILEESHTTGRYQLRGQPRPVRLGYSHFRNIDLYFTDPAGTNVLVGGGGGGSSDLPSASDIASRSDLISFFDFSNSAKLTVSGSNITGFEAVNDSNQSYSSTSGNNVNFADFGSNSGKCINFTGDWVRFTDSTGFDEAQNGNVSLLFRSQASSDTYCIFQRATSRLTQKKGTSPSTITRT